MAREQLPQGQIQPAARPVSSFVQPGLIQAARPSEPGQLRLTNDSIGLVQRQSGGNVAGYDRGEQLARALAPFSEKLTNLMQFGVELYASNEYKQGQNEALKAYTLANRQVMASADEYATQNRAVARQDPIQGLLMDRVNPFRTAGRQNQLSQLAGAEMPATMRKAFQERRADLAELDPADPRVNQVKADAIAQVVEKFGINEYSPGFMDYVAPRMNAEWDRVTQQQIDDHNNYLDETVPRMAASTMYGRIKQGMSSGAPMTQIVANETMYLDAEARRFGIPGKGQEMKEKAIQRLFVMAVDANGNVDMEMRLAVSSILVGPPDKDGFRATAAQMYGLEMLESADKYDQIRSRSQRARQEQLGSAYADAIAGAIIGVPDGPEKGAALQQLRNDPQFLALPIGERLKIEQQIGNVTEDVANRSYADDGGSIFLQQIDTLYGDSWDPKFADTQHQIERQLVAPERRAQFDSDYAAVRRRKEEQKKSMPEGLITGAITRQVKANLEARYPDMVTAAMRGARNIEEIMATGDADASRSAALQNGAYRAAVYNAIDAKRGDLGRDLTPAEFQQTIDAALAGYEKNAPQTWKTLFPGVGNQPSVVPYRTSRPDPDRPEPPKPPPGRRVQSTPTFQAGQLDNMPNREQRLQNWRGEAVLSAPEAARLIPLALGGQSLPAPLQRAAKAAGTSPQQFLLQQADFYPNDIRLTPAQRSQLGRSGQQSSATSNYAQNVASAPQSSPLAAAGTWFLDAITGTRPAAAATIPPFGGRSMNSGSMAAISGGNDFGGLAALTRSGEGGWNSVNYGTTTSGSTMNLVGQQIGVIEQMQRQGRVFAVGAYQFTPGVLVRARTAAGLPPSAPMTPENQTKMFFGLILNSNKRPVLRDYLKGVNSDLRGAHRELSLEWAAVQGPDGRGAYDGDKAGNFASLPAERVRQALIRARQAITGGRN